MAIDLCMGCKVGDHGNCNHLAESNEAGTPALLLILHQRDCKSNEHEMGMALPALETRQEMERNKGEG
jgi:hypothetical protein